MCQSGCSASSDGAEKPPVRNFSSAGLKPTNSIKDRIWLLNLTWTWICGIIPPFPRSPFLSVLRPWACWEKRAGVTGTRNPIQRRIKGAEEQDLHRVFIFTLCGDLQSYCSAFNVTLTCLQSSLVFQEGTWTSTARCPGIDSNLSQWVKFWGFYLIFNPRATERLKI